MDLLPWVAVVVMFSGMLAVTVYVFRAFFQASKQLGKALTASPADALGRMGFSIERSDVAGGRASTMWSGIAVRVEWQMSAQYSGQHINPNQYRTWVSAQIAPALGLGLQVLEQGGGAPVGDPRLDGRVVAHARDVRLGCARLCRAAAPLATMLGTEGQLSVTDDTVSVVVAAIEDDEAVLRQRLDGVSSAARALAQA